MKTVAAALALALALVLPAQNASATIDAVWANDGGDKVTQDELRASNAASVTNSVWDGTTIRLFGAKNEIVNFNLILEAATQAAGNVSVSISNLTGPGGAVIRFSQRSTSDLFNWTGTEIELFYVRYLQIRGSAAFGGTLANWQEATWPKRSQCPPPLDPGCSWSNRPVADKFFPDIAVPLELVPTFDIAAGTNQSIWGDIYVPKTIAAGVYTGTVTISEGGSASHTVPVRLTVRNFALPDSPNSKTMLYSAVGDLVPRYGDTNAMQAAANQIRVAHRHKISIIDDNMGAWWDGDAPASQWIPFLDGSAFTAAGGYAGPGVGIGNGVFSIGTYGNMTQPSTQSAFTTRFNNWESWFAANSPSTERFAYLCDEILCNNQTPTLATQLGWWSAIAGPGRSLPTMATQPLIEAAPTILSDPTSTYGYGDPAKFQPAADAVKADPNRRLFAYNGGRPGSGTFNTDEVGVALRQLAWAQYKKGIDRWFFWEATYYEDFQNGRGHIDVFTTAETFVGRISAEDAAPFIEAYGGYYFENGDGAWYFGNGDGLLFYPGTDLKFPGNSYGINGPISSLRLKHWRRGIQDIDYVVLASQINPTAVQNLVNQKVPKALWENQCVDVNDCSYFIGPITWSENPDDWEAARAQLAAIIDPGSVAQTAPHDFNGDSKSDLLWRHKGGTVATWLMNGSQVMQAGSFGTVPGNWQIVGQRDFDGDGKHDFLWRDGDTGTVAIWLVTGLQVAQTGSFGAVDSNWAIFGTGDFNGDGKGSILWRHMPTGMVGLWILNGLQVAQSGVLGAVPGDWEIHGTGDFDGDGKSDILWRDANTGAVAIWLMNGLQIASAGGLGTVPGNWAIRGTGDFNGDGKSDLLWQDTGTGTVAIWLMNGLQVVSSGALGNVPSEWSVVETGDFNGNGKSDILWHHGISGTVAIWFMDGLQVSPAAIGGASLDWILQGLHAD